MRRAKARQRTRLVGLVSSAALTSWCDMSCACGPTAVAAACYAKLHPIAGCRHEATDAVRVQVLGLHCAGSTLPAERGFVLASLTAGGSAACTGGDSYHAHASESSVLLSDAAHFASLSTPMATEHPHLYWVSLAATAAVPGRRSYDLTISLVETQQRELQLAEGRGPLVWSTQLDESPLDDFLRDRRCVWQRLPVPVVVRVEASSADPASEPQCHEVTGLSPMAYISLGAEGCGGGLCLGDARARILNTSNRQRLALRTSKSFAHLLKPVGCRYRWYDETALTTCLAGRAVLNMGSSLATDVSKGLARINNTLRAWTHRRPDEAGAARLIDGQRLPQVADFHYQFERTGGFFHNDKMVGASVFGRSRVTTMLLDHPSHYGLINVLEPRTVQQHEARVGFPSAARYEDLMCSHDVLLFESGVHDFGLPFTESGVTPFRSRLGRACAGRPVAECRTALWPALKNQSWRLRPLRAYRERLGQLLAMWARCRKARPGFRAFFKLAPAPRARGALAAGSSPRMNAVDDCVAAQYGYSTQAHHVAVFNAVARDLVAAAGFEVFDSFGVTLNAHPRWFDDARIIRNKVFEAEALSDLTTQLWLNQLCSH